MRDGNIAKDLNIYILNPIYNSSAWQSYLREKYIWNNIKHSLRRFMEQTWKYLVNAKTYMIHSEYG